MLEQVLLVEFEVLTPVATKSAILWHLAARCITFFDTWFQKLQTPGQKKSCQEQCDGSGALVIYSHTPHSLTFLV
jgi:hypothetical protein